jgi:hypothetical protein
MSAARDLLDDLAVIGATIEPAGDRLLLRAGATAIPAALVSRIREAKADLIPMLTVQRNRAQVREEQERLGSPPRHDAKDAISETRITKWLNQHPSPSAPGRCAWCGNRESPSAVVLPFGTEPGTHTWLHAECWRAWQQARRADAVAALRSMGLLDQSPAINRT